METKQQEFSSGYFLTGLLAVAAIRNFPLAPHTENLASSEFKVLLQDGSSGATAGRDCWRALSIDCFPIA